MSWVFLSDEAPGHHKLLGLSDAAFRLWIVGLTYCGQQANDGSFSAHAARIMCGYLASPELGKAAIAELVTARLWHASEGGYEIHDYLDYQQSKDSRAASNKAAAERMRAMRAARHGVVTPPVRDPLRCNTGVTSSELPAKFALPVPIPSRPDPVLNTDSLVDSGPSQPELKLEPQQAAESGHKSQPNEQGEEQSHAKPKRASAHTAIATTLLGELSAARMRINPKNRVFPPSPAHLREIERCLREGLTVDQLRNVILVWEEMVKAGKLSPDNFDSLTPFRAANVAKYTEKSLEEARRPWNQAPQAMRPPEPTRAAGNPPGGLDLEAARAKAADKVDPVVQAQLDKLLGRTPC